MKRRLPEDFEYEWPVRKYRIVFLPSCTTVEVDPERIPYSGTGLAGSLLDVAAAHDPAIGLRRDCGGLCACSTCAVIVTRGLKDCNPRHELEDELLREEVDGATANYRLACQCVPNGRGDVVVVVPD